GRRRRPTSRQVRGTPPAGAGDRTRLTPHRTRHRPPRNITVLALTSRFHWGNIVGTGARKRLAVMGGTLAAALLATGLGLYATDSGPFRDSYCWGAWEANSGPSFLDDGKLDEPGSHRKSRETATPSAGHPRGSCWVEVTSGDGDDTSQDAVRFSEKVTVQVGPLPAAKAGRHDWLAQHFHGSAAPLPGGLVGMVGGHRGMLVLP